MAHVPSTAARLLVTALPVTAACVACVACTAFETNLQDTDVNYAETAKANFDQGEQAFKDGRYAEAVKFFEHTKNKFPYSKFAVQAELRTADAHFAREKWLEAADAYKIFCRFHPRDDKVGYATYRVALAYAKEIDQDVWWMPSAVERDQSAARDAIRAFDEFLARFPDDEHAAEAKKLRTDARARLAENDLYAARFYEEREKWKGALWRYQRVANEYGDTPRAASALLRAAQIADGKLADAAAAQLLYEQLVREHPGAPEADDAKRALAARAKTPPAPPTPLPAPTPPAAAAPSPAAG
ncbi:MAG: outer membrane protein assembly factor BamD [Deltaproteobacteria bacterium]|nr:outer membrane protein assembly factor BamD [Deltaproteobacteria bacterium]